MNVLFEKIKRSATIQFQNSLVMWNVWMVHQPVLIIRLRKVSSKFGVYKLLVFTELQLLAACLLLLSISTRLVTVESLHLHAQKWYDWNSELYSKKIGFLPNLKKVLASCETKKGSSPGYTGRTFSSESF
jgi:hypothetical protein